MKITELSDLTIGHCIVWKLHISERNSRRVYYYINKLNDQNLEAYKLEPRDGVHAITLFDYTELFGPEAYDDEVYDTFMSAKMVYPEFFI